MIAFEDPDHSRSPTTDQFNQSLSIRSNQIQLNRPPLACFACIGEKNEFRLAEGLNCMAMYAMGVESCSEVLVYLNRALDICNYNRAVNG